MKKIIKGIKEIIIAMIVMALITIVVAYGLMQQSFRYYPATQEEIAQMSVLEKAWYGVE